MSNKLFAGLMVLGLVGVIWMLRGCGALDDHLPVITSKVLMVHYPGMCTFQYTGLGKEQEEAFTDSCKLYRVGDTIRSSPR